MFASLRYAAAALALCSCARTYEMHVESSGGVILDESVPVGGGVASSTAEVYGPAVHWSATHDLACPWPLVSVQSARAPTFVADGCGQRAVYACAPTGSRRWGHAIRCEMVLVNKFAL